MEPWDSLQWGRQLEHIKKGIICWILRACLSVKWYWQSFFHSSRSSVRAPSSGHTWPKLTRSLPSDRRCMMFSCRLMGSSVRVMPVDVGWRGTGSRKKVVNITGICIFARRQILVWRLPCWSGCCPAAAAIAWCSPCDAPRCWCSPPGPTCPCPARDHTARCRVSSAAPWWAGRSAGHRELRRESGEIQQTQFIAVIITQKCRLKAWVTQSDYYPPGKRPSADLSWITEKHIIKPNVLEWLCASPPTLIIFLPTGFITPPKQPGSLFSRGNIEFTQWLAEESGDCQCFSLCH